MSFESDLIELRESPSTAPARQMRVRHQMRWNSSSSLAQMLGGARSAQYQVVALYDLAASKGSRPVVVVEIESSFELGGVEQGAVVTVRGWPAVGRAVVLDIDGDTIEATHPCVSPVFRSLRFE